MLQTHWQVEAQFNVRQASTNVDTLRNTLSTLYTMVRKNAADETWSNINRLNDAALF